MSAKVTEDVQNIIARLLREVYLNVDNPSEKVKRQYFKARNALGKARDELDILNDYKEEFNKANR
mgnify:CR=1 FL=1